MTKRLIDLVEAEIRELLNKYGFPGDTTPIIRGSGLKALEAKSVDDEWVKPAVLELVKTLDGIHTRTRSEQTDKPFLVCR